jgi:diadenylate cyclase
MLLLINFRILDFADIFLVALLLFNIYKLAKGTVAMNIFAGLATLYLAWLVVGALDMQLLSAILGQFVGVGMIAVIIVFQQEIRRFLLLLGSRYVKNRFWLKYFMLGSQPTLDSISVASIVQSCQYMAESGTGALIVLCASDDALVHAQTGTEINGDISSQLLTTIFHGKSALHDGAVIIKGSKIIAAGCILPSSDTRELPQRFGTRHRAALGMSEATDSLVIAVSEERGEISCASKGALHTVSGIGELTKILSNFHK